MKTIKLTVLFLFFPLVFFAQTLTGLWTGTLTNDSTTIRRDQSFEIVLTQYKDKVYGYSRMTFFVHDTLYYIVKRVKGTIEGEVCEVRDDDIISHNFPRKPERGVKLISIFRRNRQDSLWYLDGDWKTTESKKYYSISGRISLKPEPDLEKSKLIPHLEELKLTDDVAIYQESKKVSASAIVINQPVKENKKEEVAKTDNPAITLPKETKASGIVQARPSNEVAARQPVITKENPAVASVNNDKKDNTTIVPEKSEPISQVKQPITNSKKEQPAIEEKKIAMPAKNNKRDSLVIVQAKSNPVIQTSQPINDSQKQPVVKEKKQEPKKSEPIAVSKPPEPKKEIAIEPVKPEIKIKEAAPVTITNDKPQPVSLFSNSKPAVSSTAAIFVAERTVTAPQIVNFTSDSLELALYDNGEIDGDTVSVLLNGEIILAKQGLKASAIKKMIYVPAGKYDSLTLVLYAENLGKYPPNTGLLVVHDGDETYQVRFSADLQQNAAVIFKRKKN